MYTVVHKDKIAEIMKKEKSYYVECKPSLLVVSAMPRSYREVNTKKVLVGSVIKRVSDRT